MFKIPVNLFTSCCDTIMPLKINIQVLGVMAILDILIVVAVLVFCVKGSELKATFKNRQLFEPYHNNLAIQVSVNLDKVISEVDERFLSIALDTSLVIKHWKSVDFSSVRFNTLARGLSPAYLRLGGNAADFLIFQRDLDVWNVELDSDPYGENYDGKLGSKNLSEFYMSAQDFDQVNKFAQKNGLRLLFDFNVLLRNADGGWNSSNAYKILEYSIEKGYDQNLLFSLGNEPNSFPHAFNRTLPAGELGKDFLTLHSLLQNDPTLAPHFRKSLLVGPDVTQPKPNSLKYLNAFLEVADTKISAITFHQYYVDGRTATLDDMMSLEVLDILTNELGRLRISLSEAGHAGHTLWLGETGSCWGGGASGLSDRYVAGFMWMDKLGQAAENGVTVVIRQSFLHGHYALVDDHFYPNPDYWLSWLFKNFVGKKVFSVSVEGSDEMRLYAHCVKHPRYQKGAVVFYGINLEERNLTLTFEKTLMDQQKHLYWLYPFGHNGLKSKQVQLNDEQKPLKMIDDDSFPDIHPVIIPDGKGISIGAHSFGFIIFPDAKAAECF